MIDVAEIVVDPDFAQPFDVYRQAGSWVEGKWVQAPEQKLSFYGTVIAANQKDIMQMPEGDRIRGMMVFYVVTDEELFITRNSPDAGTSDQIEWNGERYRIFQLYPYRDYGYWKAMAARMAGD